MRSTTYGNLVNGLSAIAGINPTNILAHEKALIAEYLTDATRFAYDYYPWPELLITEQRALREDWTAKSYSIGDEVYHDGKYYRCYSTLFIDLENYDPPSDNFLEWHEIGDNFEDDLWNEESVYRIGARVKYNDKVYLCIDQLAGNTSSGVIGVNYEWDKITPADTNYWQEIDVKFDRYLPYEVEGYNTIGTFISAHLTDPRYSNAQTLNWREGAEGIYLEKLDNFPNKVWVKYRVEAPEYTINTSDDTLVSRSLAPAIKTYAYKSWLIGDGQHEKAELQDIRFMDMLVREIDKLNGQQDRAVPFQVQSEPYRRVNARVDYIVEKTFDKIHQIHNAYSNPRIKFGVTSIGKQSVKRGSAKPKISVEAFSNGLNIVRKGKTLVTPKVWTFVSGKQATKVGTSHSSFKIFTGKPHRSIAVGFVQGEAGVYVSANISFGISTNISRVVDITRTASSSFNLNTNVNARYANLEAGVNSNILTTTGVLGRQARVGSEADSAISLTTTIPPDFTGTLFELDETLYTGKGSERVHHVYVAGLKHDVDYELPSFDNPSNGDLAYRVTPYTHIYLVSETGHTSQKSGYKQFRVRVREGGIRSGSLNGELSTETYLWDAYPIVGSFNTGLDWYAVYYDTFTYSYSADWYPQMNPIPDYPTAQGILGVIAGGSKNASLVSNISLQTNINGELDLRDWANSNSTWAESNQIWG